MSEDTQDTGDTTEAAAPVAEEVREDAAAAKEDMVPVSALQAERQQRQQLQESLRMYQDHMALMQANHSKQPQKPDVPDDELLTYGEARRVLQTMSEAQRAELAELKAMQKHKDYEEVIAQHLPEVLKQNPSLKDTLKADPNKFETAYYLAKNSDSYRQKHAASQRSQDAQKMVQNAKRPGSLSSVGGASASAEGSHWKTMSDEEFMAKARKNLGY